MNSTRKQICSVLKNKYYTIKVLILKLKHKNIAPICKICNKEFKNLNALCTHFQKLHKLSAKEYYDRFIKVPGEGICKVCGNPTNFSNKLRYGYSQFCSQYCASHSDDRIQRIVNTRRMNGVWFPNGVLSRDDTRDEYIRRTGHDYLYNTEESKELHRKRNAEFVFKKYQEQIKAQNCELLEYNNLHYKCHCNVCNTDFYIMNQALKIRLIHNTPLCTNCNHISNITSDGENSLYNFIEANVSSPVLKNDRKVLDGKELDIYLPELKLAFEFDGKYWHADSRFYKPDSIIHTGITAKDIWEQDNKKDLLCEQKGIMLVRIKEYDWLYNQEFEKYKILNIIAGLQNIK